MFVAIWFVIRLGKLYEYKATSAEVTQNVVIVRESPPKCPWLRFRIHCIYPDSLRNFRISCVSIEFQEKGLHVVTISSSQEFLFAGLCPKCSWLGHQHHLHRRLGEGHFAAGGRCRLGYQLHITDILNYRNFKAKEPWFGSVSWSKESGQQKKKL